MSTAPLTDAPATTDAQLVLYEVREGVAILTLNAPDTGNTYTYEMMQELDAAILRARMDEKVYVIVLIGAGDKMFCAGANINMLKTMDPTFKYYFCLHANETLNRLEQTPKLVIAALNGHAVGGGLEIAMAADIRIARRGSAKFGLPEVTLGVLPGTGGTQRLPRLIGNKSLAIELMITGEVFDVDRAQELGLINHIYHDEEGQRALTREEFLTKVLEYAAKQCPPNRAAKAAGRIKRAVQSGVEVPFESALAIERELQQQLFQSEDAKEGLSAYIEKRQPNFSGR